MKKLNIAKARPLIRMAIEEDLGADARAENYALVGVSYLC